MPPIVEANEAYDPVDVRLLGAPAVVQLSQRRADHAHEAKRTFRLVVPAQMHVWNARQHASTCGTSTKAKDRSAAERSFVFRLRFGEGWLLLVREKTLNL